MEMETDADTRYRAHLRTRLRDSRVPESLWDGLVEYIVARRPMGHFLTAVAANDLKEACGRADAENRQHLFDLVFFLHNYAPGECWGSPEKVQAWLTEKKEKAPQIYE
jgi:hypothetical protein